MLFRDMTFYMIVCTLTKIFHSDLRQIRIFTAFHAVSFLHVSQSPVPVSDLGISYSKPCSIYVTIYVVDDSN